MSVICELQKLNKCMKQLPGLFCLSLSKLYWIVKREVKKESSVVSLTEEPHCGASERGTTSASLCFILEWLQRKIINTMKSKFLSERRSRKHLFSKFSFKRKSWNHHASLLCHLRRMYLLKAERQPWRCVVGVLTCVLTRMNRHDGWKNCFWMDGQMTDAWISPH